MAPKEFFDLYREAFTEKAPAPIAFGYDYAPVCESRNVPRCMIGAIRKVADGTPLTLHRNNVQCGGGKLYTMFAPMPERVPSFVSETERYKASEGMVVEYVRNLGLSLSEKPYLNFTPVSLLDSWNGIEGILFFATPDMLSGLASWAFYDNNGDDAVVTRFASGCAGIVTFAIQENRNNGRSCFLSGFDPSARPLIPQNELTFTIPMSRFKEMMETMRESALFRKACNVVRRRISGS